MSFQKLPRVLIAPLSTLRYDDKAAMHKLHPLWLEILYDLGAYLEMWEYVVESRPVFLLMLTLLLLLTLLFSAVFFVAF